MGISGDKKKNLSKKNKKKNKKKKKSKKNLLEMVLLSMSNYLDRLFSFERKVEFYSKENENEIYLVNEKILKLIQKISTSLNYRNVQIKIEKVVKKNKGESNESDNEDEDKELINGDDEKMEVDDEGDSD